MRRVRWTGSQGMGWGTVKDNNKPEEKRETEKNRANYFHKCPVLHTCSVAYVPMYIHV